LPLKSTAGNSGRFCLCPAVRKTFFFRLPQKAPQEIPAGSFLYIPPAGKLFSFVCPQKVPQEIPVGSFPHIPPAGKSSLFSFVRREWQVYGLSVNRKAEELR
jgi:hypothetical protein